MNRILLRAPATIANFGPGFDIFAIALAEPHDDFWIQTSGAKGITIRIEGREEGLPCRAEDNAAGIAAAHFLTKTGLACGVEIVIRKSVKSCSGLGTSGASAAAAVFGLNRLLGTGLSDVEIIDLARQGETATGSTAHADNVAGCLLGGFVMVSSYSPLTVEKLELPELQVVVASMKKPQQSTRRFIPEKMSLELVRDQMARCSSLVKAVMSRDLEGIGRAINTDHISEPVRGRYIPGYEDIKRRVLDAGAYGCNVSGGGSSVFAICGAGDRKKIAGIMEVGFRKHGQSPEILITRTSNEGVCQIDEP